MVKKPDNILVGLDLGTTKVCAIVGAVKDSGKVDIIGIGISPSHGLKKGVVVNIDSTVESVRKAVREAELMAGVEIDSVYVGISGSHIKGINSRGVVAIKNKEVNPSDVARVIDAARAVNIPMDQQVLHVLPQEFIIDDQDGIKEPLGMYGVRLEAKVHIITGAVTSIQNIVKSCSRAGLRVNDLVLQPLASSQAVLTGEERDLGVVVVDIGGGTSDVALFLEGSLWHTEVLPIGGNHLTNDISIGLRTPASEAEKIKIKYGCALSSLVKHEDTIDVPSVGGRPPRVLSRQILCEIIEPRVEELFGMVQQRLKKSGFEDMFASGIVLTGGAALMEGLQDAAEHYLGLPIRRGTPRHIGGLMDVVNSPIYATGVGLVLYGAENQQDAPRKFMSGGVMNRFWKWLGEYI
ncbi:MAG: cell division protein FtsA [Nitrospirae bacterium GWC2_57_13]|nr:MAG: cell division protein FtsA [Nitrospirae bacterium GWC2_57_13]